MRFLPTVLVAAAIANGSAASASPQMVPVNEAPLTVGAVREDFDRYVGRRVRVEGFLIFTRRNALLLQGMARPGFVMRATRGFEGLVGFGCTFFNQPAPLELRDLSAREARNVAARVRRPNRSLSLLGQRVVVEGSLRARPPLREDFLGPPIEGVELDRLEAPRIVSVENIYCRGHQDLP